MDKSILAIPNETINDFKLFKRIIDMYIRLYFWTYDNNIP